MTSVGASTVLGKRSAAQRKHCQASVGCNNTEDLCTHFFCPEHCGMPRCRHSLGRKIARRVPDAAAANASADSLAMMDDDVEEAAEPPQTAATIFLERFQSAALSARAVAFATPSLALLVVLDSDDSTWLHLHREQKLFAKYVIRDRRVLNRSCLQRNRGDLALRLQGRRAQRSCCAKRRLFLETIIRSRARTGSCCTGLHSRALCACALRSTVFRGCDAFPRRDSGSCGAAREADCAVGR